MIQEEPLEGGNVSCLKEPEKGQCGLLVPTVSTMPFLAEMHGLVKSQLTHCRANRWTPPESGGCVTHSHAQGHFRELWFRGWKSPSLAVCCSGSGDGLWACSQPTVYRTIAPAPNKNPDGSVCAQGDSSGKTSLHHYYPIEETSC